MYVVVFDSEESFWSGYYSFRSLVICQIHPSYSFSRWSFVDIVHCWVYVSLLRIVTRIVARCKPGIRKLRISGSKHLGKWATGLGIPPLKNQGPAWVRSALRRAVHTESRTLRFGRLPYMLSYVVLSAHILPHFAIFCHITRCPHFPMKVH